MPLYLHVVASDIYFNLIYLSRALKFNGNVCSPLCGELEFEFPLPLVVTVQLFYIYVCVCEKGHSCGIQEVYKRYTKEKNKMKAWILR